jgi:hypothetical protein
MRRRIWFCLSQNATSSITAPYRAIYKNAEADCHNVDKKIRIFLIFFGILIFHLFMACKMPKKALSGTAKIQITRYKYAIPSFTSL